MRMRKLGDCHIVVHVEVILEAYFAELLSGIALGCVHVLLTLP